MAFSSSPLCVEAPSLFSCLFCHQVESLRASSREGTFTTFVLSWFRLHRTGLGGSGGSATRFLVGGKPVVNVMCGSSLTGYPCCFLEVLQSCSPFSCLQVVGHPPAVTSASQRRSDTDCGAFLHALIPLALRRCGVYPGTLP